jgi:hypothetical protein
MNDDWEYWAIWLPGHGSELGIALEVFLKEHGFRETDWCELRAPDGATAFYGPSDPPPPQ